MMDFDFDQTLVFTKLVAIKHKYSQYFSDNNYTLSGNVKIIWNVPASAHVIHGNLPFDITCEIEEMFWRY